MCLSLILYCVCVVEAAVFLAQGSGPVIGGIWAVQSGFMAPFLCAVILLIISLVWIYFMPESLPQDSPTRSRPLTLDPIASIRSIIEFSTINVPVGKSGLPFVLASFAFSFLAVGANGMISPLYLKHTLHWDSDKYGIAASMQGIVLVLGMVFLRPLFRMITGYEVHPVVWILIGSSTW